MSFFKHNKVWSGITIPALSVLLLLGAVFFTLAEDTSAEQEPIAEVNGDVITAVEFDRMLRLQRADVIDYFTRTYGAQFDKDFWHTSYKDEIPSDKAKEWALREAVKLKLQLRLAQDNGIIQGTSYNYLISEMDKENERRSSAKRSGEPIYGPVQYDENTFVDFFLSKKWMELKEKLSEGVLAVTDEQLKKHYEKIKAELFPLEDHIRFNKIAVSYKVESESGESELKQAAKAVMDQIKQKLEQGQTAAEAVKELKDLQPALPIQYTEEQFNPSTASRYYKTQPMLYEALRASSNANPMTSIIDDRAAGQYVLAQMTERVPGGYKSFEEQKLNVRKHYLDNAYNSYVDSLIQKAEVTIVENNYDNASMD
jgi:hypothetical protein